MKELVEKYKYGKGIRQYSDRYKKGIGDRFWGQITSKNDVSKIVERAKNVVSYFEKDFKWKLISENIEEIQMELGKYELALCKIIQMNDFILKPKENNFDYTSEEFMQLLNDLENLKERLSDIMMRKACQD